MILFSVCKTQYFISHTMSQRPPAMRHRLSCQKANLHSTLETRAWDTCGWAGETWFPALMCARDLGNYSARSTFTAKFCFHPFLSKMFNSLSFKSKSLLELYGPPFESFGKHVEAFLPVWWAGYACCVKLPVIVLKSIFHEQKKVKSFLTRGDARVTMSYCRD